MSDESTAAREYKTLDDIFAEPDTLDLLTVKTSQPASTAGRRLLNSFQEVVCFAEQHGRPPSADADDFEEARLGTRLAAIRNNSDHVATLRGADALGLLASVGSAEGKASLSSSSLTKKAEDSNERSTEDSTFSIDDILTGDDILGLLDVGDEGLFDFRHVPRRESRDIRDDIAQRTRCDDFYKFESLFERLHEKLRVGEIETLRFSKETQIREGDAFILNGMLCLIDRVGSESKEAGRFNPRLRVIFDNGTESNLLMRSLAAVLYRDDHGRRILRDDFVDRFNNISLRDQRAGVVYILRSLSEQPEVAALRDLYKIGYTEHTVESRIAHAEHDKTFLEAPVKIVTTFECYNVNPNKFEHLVHAMLAHQRMNMTLRARDGELYRPREWFVVELNTAREVVRRIIDGTIANYRMDNTTGRIVAKVKHPSTDR